VTRDFESLVDVAGLSAEQRERLEEVHGLLLVAGPPPELGEALAKAPAQSAAAEAEPEEPAGAVVHRLPRRRLGALLVAAALGVACFAGGYLVGHSSSRIDVVRVVSLEGVGVARPASASLKVGAAQEGGNSTIELVITGLPQQGERGYYELFTWRRGKPGYPCGGFKMEQGTTTVRFTIPYELREDTKLVVTAIEPGKVHWPGKVVMKTV
jgi:hypothetical protein